MAILAQMAERIMVKIYLYVSIIINSKCKDTKLWVHFNPYLSNLWQLNPPDNQPVPDQLVHLHWSPPCPLSELCVSLNSLFLNKKIEFTKHLYQESCGFLSHIFFLFWPWLVKYEFYISVWFITFLFF